MVFIGKDLNHEVIQMLLDRCLLSDEEMEMGPRMWQELWWDEDKLKLPTKIYVDDYANAINVEANVLNPVSEMVEIYEDKEEEDETKVEFNSSVSVTMISPQVAPTFVYDP